MKFIPGYSLLFLFTWYCLPMPQQKPKDLLPAEQRFTDNQDGTITDKSLQLVWKKCVQNDNYDSINNRCTGTIDSSIYEFRYCDQQNNSCNGGVTGQVLSAGGNSEAFNSCDALNGGSGFGGKTNWRVPRTSELLALIPEPTTFFNNAPDNSTFWTADSSATFPEEAIFIAAVVATMGDFAKTSKAYVRCVSSLP